MIKQSEALLTGIKAILESTTDYRDTKVVTTSQEINKSTFPLVVFNTGRADLTELGIKPNKETTEDGTSTVSVPLVYDSGLQIYADSSVVCSDIAQTIILGTSSEHFLSTVSIKCKELKIQDIAINYFVDLIQEDDVQKDEKFLHMVTLIFKWNFTGTLNVTIPCFTQQTAPKFTVEKLTEE